MLTTVKGTYDHGQIIWDEVPPVQKRTKVIVTFLEESLPAQPNQQKKREGGSMKGEVWMSDTFNEPLDDLNKHM